MKKKCILRMKKFHLERINEGKFSPVQNPGWNFSTIWVKKKKWIFLLEFWRKHFWESWSSSASSDSSFVEIVFKLIFSPEDEIAKLFESTKHKCLHILFSGGIYFWERNLFKNHFLLKKLNPKTNFTLSSKYITLRDSVLCFV